MNADHARCAPAQHVWWRPAEAPLPANWSVYLDDASGSDYYANDMTGVTTWEHPLHEHFRCQPPACLPLKSPSLPLFANLYQLNVGFLTNSNVLVEIDH
eukprot:scaffold22011_cov19-Prasinocladus_malaysianus.AAC.1